MTTRMEAGRESGGSRAGRNTVQILVVLLGFLTAISLINSPLRFLSDPTASNLGRYWPNRVWLLLHIVGGCIAIVIGSVQFSRHIRQRLPHIHRWSGRLYLGGVLTAGGSAFYLSFFAESASFGAALFALATVWWVASARGFLAIRQGRITEHRRWMIRSYILAFTFVAFRWMTLLPIWEPFGAHRAAVATWVAWVVPLAAVELFFRRARHLSPETV